MSELPCPLCGKPSKGVCPQCFLKRNPIQVVKQSFRECDCGLSFFKGKWFRDRHEMLQELAEKSIKAPSDVLLKVKDVDYTTERGEVTVKAMLRGYFKGVGFEDELSWEVRPDKVKCEDCKRMNTGYYEAVLQVRGDDIPLGLDDKKVGGVKRARGGVDIYMLSNEYANAKASELIAKGFQVVKSSKLHTKKDGKDIYRHYYSIKYQPFKVGDFMEVEGKIYRVLELGKTMKMQDIDSKKVRSFRIGELRVSKIIASSSDIRHGIVSEVRPGGMQILELGGAKTYELKHDANLKAGDEVSYLPYGGKIHLL